VPLGRRDSKAGSTEASAIIRSLESTRITEGDQSVYLRE
jgi:hypothetical protein